MLSRYAIRRFAKSCAVCLLGAETKPRTVLRGLARGYQIYVSPVENLGYLLGTAEPHLQRAIKIHVARSAVAYDIGANVGFASLALAKRVGRTGHVVAFEPLPENAKRLRSGIEQSRLDNVEVLQYAVSDTSGQAILRVAENVATASLVWHRNNPQARDITVPTVVIDELVQTRVIPPPQFVKIDVEGAEGYVLTGMRRTIAQARPIIFVECSDAGRAATWEILSGLDYRCQSAINRKPIITFEEYRHADFLWLPQAERL